MLCFRTDGNSSIGIGHIMRCLSIADAAKRLGEKSVFLVASDDLKYTIKEHGHEVKILNTNYDNMNIELGQTIAIISALNPVALFVDSYYVTNVYLDALRKLMKRIGSPLVYIDDVLSFSYPCDILINYNIYAAELDYRILYMKKEIPRLLLGTRYAPLRAEFQNTPPRIVNKEGHNILISTGGTDFEHIELGLMEKIISKGKELKDLFFHFIIGSMNKDVEKIHILANKSNNIITYYNVSNISELMQSVDLAISAAGSTLYELCATKTATITYTLADNQILGADCFSKFGVVKYIGDVRVLGVEELTEKLIVAAVNLANNYEERRLIAEEQYAIIDGRGAERIIEKIKNL